MIFLRSKAYFKIATIWFFAFKRECESQCEIRPMEGAVWDKSDYYEGCVKGRTIPIWDHRCSPWSWKMKYSALVRGTWRADWMLWLQAFLITTQKNYFPLHTQSCTPTHNWLHCHLSFPLLFLPTITSTSNTNYLPCCIVACNWNARGKNSVFLIVGVELGAVVSVIKAEDLLQILEMVPVSLFPFKILGYFNTWAGMKKTWTRDLRQAPSGLDLWVSPGIDMNEEKDWDIFGLKD